MRLSAGPKVMSVDAIHRVKGRLLPHQTSGSKHGCCDSGTLVAWGGDGT